MKRWTQTLETLRRQAQLVGARQDQRNVRRRAVGEPPTPRSQRAEDTEQGDAGAQRRNVPQASEQARPRRGARRQRANRQVSLLTTLAQSEEQNQETVAKVWYLWRHKFLVAKQLEVKMRRGLASDEGDDLLDGPGTIEGNGAVPFNDEEALQP